MFKMVKEHKLENLEEEAENIRRILEGGLVNKIVLMLKSGSCPNSFSYYKTGVEKKNGLLYTCGHYFGIKASAEICEDLEEKSKKENVRHYSIMVHRDGKNTPKIVELSDNIQTYIIRKEPEIRVYIVTERSGGFIVR